MVGQLQNITALPWKRFLAEAVLIVSSVYLAIVLEGASTEKERKTEAIAALTNLRAELDSDQADGLDILALQNDQGRSHQQIQAWLSDPANVPADSLSAAPKHALRDNRTVFPRDSSWTTMVAEGQLAVGNMMLQAQRQNRGYMALVSKWLEEVESVQRQVDTYLHRSGRDT